MNDDQKRGDVGHISVFLMSLKKRTPEVRERERHLSELKGLGSKNGLRTLLVLPSQKPRMRIIIVDKPSANEMKEMFSTRTRHRKGPAQAESSDKKEIGKKTRAEAPVHDRAEGEAGEYKDQNNRTL